MTAAPDSSRSERLSYHYPPSPPSSATVTAPSSPRPDSEPRKDRIFISSVAPRRTTSHKIPIRNKWPHDRQSDSGGSGTESKQPHATSSSDSPERVVPIASTSRIGRKVAASLDLFKETATSPPIEDVSPFERPRPVSSASKRKSIASHPIQDVGEPQFEFVKRSDWPDREAAAIRREKSMTGLERVRTRDSVSSVTSTRDHDTRRRKERTLSRRENVLSDLTQWRSAVAAGQDDGRGRPRERSVWVEDSVHDLDIGSPGTDSSISSASTYHEDGRKSPPSIIPRYPPSPSPSRSPVARASPPSNDTLEPLSSPFGEHEIPPPSRLPPSSRSRSPTPVQTEPFRLALAAPGVPDSPWSTDDESAWETASITTTTSTTSASSPFPLSPSRTSPLPHPLVRHASDEDEEQRQRAMLAPYDDIELGSANMSDAVEGDIARDFGFNFSQESLPHIPLRPFRNQVGGHNAIYKFTKRAVCKPLVSRENLFYEAVEREAPPLLDFIPRYLGVMLVSYRRVRRGSSGSPKMPSTLRPGAVDGGLTRGRPPLYKSPSESKRSPGSLASDAPNNVPAEEDQGEATDTGEAELPEVALDYNRHIIPQWMLRGGRGRALSHSYASTSPPSHPVHRRLRRQHLNGATASSPDLGMSASRAVFSTSGFKPTPSRLARPHSVTVAELDGRTSTASPRFGPTQLPGWNPPGTPLSLGSSFQSGWFGGTGSTVVNTKFKDHVFSTLLRRLCRQGSGRTLSPRLEDDGEIADAEGEGDDTSLCDEMGRLQRKKKLSRVERLRQEEGSFLGQPLRRVQSETQLASHVRRADQRSSSSDLFDFEYDEVATDGAVSLRDSCTPESFAARSYRRSRSRSQEAFSRSMLEPHMPSLHRDLSEPREPDPTVTRQNHFILMEDLTGRLKYSCVLDLKMGTRQYGMDATLPKKKSQRKKCDRTTSRSLGVRVCGMQVWNHTTQSYVTQDKYKGREVRPEDFPGVLVSFLHDGERLLVYQIPVILTKLYTLARIIFRLKGYRFYGCSLLMIYDGDRDVQEVFRASVLDHPSSRSKRGESLERRLDGRAAHDINHDHYPLRRSRSEDLLVGPVADRSSRRHKRGEVQIRLVDFAHTTTGQDWLPYPPPGGETEEVTSGKGYHAEVDPETGLIYARFPPHYPEQPDRGFLFGLMNLAETLERIWNEERIRRIKASRDLPSAMADQLPPLSTDGKEIFDEIFKTPEGEEDFGMIST